MPSIQMQLAIICDRCYVTDTPAPCMTLKLHGAQVTARQQVSRHSPTRITACMQLSPIWVSADTFGVPVNVHAGFSGDWLFWLAALATCVPEGPHTLRSVCCAWSQL